MVNFLGQEGFLVGKQHVAGVKADELVEFN
jgi:hypothetical protein